MPMKTTDITMANAASFAGQEIAVTDWYPVTQEDINAFADVTHDHNFLHVDPERSRIESPTGGTIAHGFYTLSLLAHFAQEGKIMPRDHAYALNYGINKVRFISPVPVGSFIRAHIKLKGFEPHKSGGMLMTAEAIIVVQGQDKPALVAEWLAVYFDKPAASAAAE